MAGGRGLDQPFRTPPDESRITASARQRRLQARKPAAQRAVDDHVARINDRAAAQRLVDRRLGLDLAAGAYTVRATLGEAAIEVPVSVPAGKTVEKVVVVATGRAIAHAYFAEGGPVVTAGPRFDVLAAEPGTDGRPVFIATSYEDGAAFDLPPGRYVMRATADAATADAGFELAAGAPIEVVVVLDAGILAVTAPGGDFLELLGSEKDIYGKRTSVAYTYGESWQLTAPAGDYVLKVRKADGSETETPATVRAGERTEVTAD